MKAYTSRFGYLTKFNGSNIGSHAHITITFLGELSDENVGVLWNELCSCITISPTFRIVGEDNFGPNKNIPVWKLQCVDNEELEHALNNFHKEFGQPDNGIKCESISWHISKRNISSDVVISIGDIITFKKFDIKQLGPFDPIYSKELI